MMKKNLIPISRQVVEITAKIFGPYSAAAQSLEDADKHNRIVNFYEKVTKFGSLIIVEKLPSID